MNASVYEQLLRIVEQRGAGFIVLIDPDKLGLDRVPDFARRCVEAEVDALFVGGSLLHATELGEYVERIKAACDLPVIGFPGSLSQLSPALDALLYLSVISGRNPEYLIGQHVSAAPLIRRLELEPISTGYMLVESGRSTTAQYMTGSEPLPRHKPDIAAATALAGEMMGMKLIYADGGSGADQPVPDELVAAVSEACSVPLAVGGGLSSPDEVHRKVLAGAQLVVIGDAIENDPAGAYVSELAAAVHGARAAMEPSQ